MTQETDVGACREITHGTWTVPADTVVGYWDENASTRCIPCAHREGGWRPEEQVTALEAQTGDWPTCKLCGAEFAPAEGV